MSKTLLFYLSILISSISFAQNKSIVGNNSTLPTGIDVSKLHSYQASEHVIYIDTDGETLTDQYWIDQSTTPQATSITQESPNLNNSTIYTIWQIISEDFRPFDINVTTDRALYDATSIENRQMVVVGPRTNNWITRSPTGLARTGGFEISSSPCFVWTSGLGTNGQTLGEFASHELGHTLGLFHDGTSKGVEYYGGHGMWAPIMGTSYKLVSQWSKCEYQDAADQGFYFGGVNQDDIAIISSKLGFRKDDHSNTTIDATPLLVNGNSVDINYNYGNIEQSTDADYFTFTSAQGGSISLSFEAAYPKPNLDIKVSLLNASQQVISTSDLSDNTNANLSLGIVAGTYYIKVEGTGNGDPLTTGYSDYGSLGYYGISGTVSGVNAVGTIAFTSHTNFQKINQASLTNIVLTSTVNSSAVSAIEYVVNGTTITTTNNAGVYEGNWIPTAYGRYEVIARLTETSGNISEASIVLDVVAPYSLKQMGLANFGTEICNNSFSPEVTLLNNGSQPITSFDLQVYLNDVLFKTQNFTTNLAVNELANFTVDNIELTTSGNHEIRVVPMNINSTNVMTNFENMVKNTNIIHQGQKYQFYIDNNGLNNNFTWSLKLDGQTIYSDEITNSSTGSTHTTIDYCLTPHCYELNTTDAFVPVGCTIQEWNATTDYNAGTKIMYQGLLYTSSSPLLAGGENPKDSPYWYTFNEGCPSTNENLVYGLTKTDNSKEFETTLGIYQGAAVHQFCVIGKPYQVTYLGNGNTSGKDPEDTEIYNSGDQVTIISKGSLVKTGYVFTGWNTASDGSGTAYSFANKFDIIGNISLYAQWALVTNENDITTEQLFIAPNPTHDICFIHGLVQGTYYEVYQVNGQKVFTGNYTTTGIDFSKYSQGLYFIKVGNQRFKVLKK